MHAIECGLNCHSLKHVVLSTDSERIAEIGKQYGAEVPFMRPGELAEDNTSMLPVMQHALQACEEHYGQRIDVLVLLDPTSPFRTRDDVENALKFFLEDPDCEAVVSGCLARKNPYFNMARLKNGYVRLVIEPDRDIGSRQQCPVVYDLDSTVWIYSRKALMEEKRRIPERTKLFLIPENSVFHIDSEWDFKMAEYFLNRKEEVTS